MIEDKENGIKIAENPIEAKWMEIKEKIEKDNLNNKISAEINDAILELAKKKIKQSK